MNWWHRISNVGLENEYDIQHVRHVHILNRILFLSSFFIGIYVPINFILGNYFFCFVQAVFFSFIIIAYYFNYKKWFRFSTYYVFFFIIVNITFAMVMHNDTGTEYLMIPSSFAPFIIFKRRDDSLIVLLFFIIACITGLLLQYYVTPLIIYKEKTRLILFFINVLISFIISGAIITSFKKVIENYENNLLMAKQKIENFNKEITASINYAQRIQQAKLPDILEIQESLLHCFLLFKPKDIVSGDFYFYHKTEQSIFIAAADCTGHGVPGAFMSLIISEKLLEAVTNVTSVSEILKIVNREIKKTLKQSDSKDSSKDGMDIAICKIDSDEKIIEYAGAHRPLWIIKKDKNEVEEIKATQKSIGGFTDNDQHFDGHNIKLKEGDTFYIFTDGYTDQFNGVTGKKLMSSRFKNILVSIKDKTMKEQELFLHNYIEEWKGEKEQVDDILVIGVRI